MARVLITGSFLMLLVGCITVPPSTYPEVEVQIPDDWTASHIPVGQINVTWWNDFEDVGLSSVVDLALSQNFNLQAASARLEQAAAGARAAEGAPVI